MTGKSRLPALVCLGLSLAPGLLPASRAFAQSDPFAALPKLLDRLDRDGFEVKRGRVGAPDPVANVCNGVIPAAWYNNVQHYLTMVPPLDGEQTRRMVDASFLLREDDALLVVGSTPPPMAYFSIQTFLYGRLDPQTGRYGLIWSYLGDTVNSLTIRTSAATPFNAPMVFLATGHRRTAERVRAALIAAGYPDSIINTETLTPSVLRFGYENADQFLCLMRTAIPSDPEVMADFLKRVVDLQQSPLRVYRVRPKTPLAPDPLPAPALRVRGTGATELDLYPALQKLREAILQEYEAKGYEASELDISLPLAEGYPSIQRGLDWLGPAQEGSLGYGRDANYLASTWFDLPEDAIAVVYGVNHAASGKATYASAAAYLDVNREAGVVGVDNFQFAHSAEPYLAGDADADKLYLWQVRRACGGIAHCLQAKTPCTAKIAPDARVRILFRAYAEPATKTGPLDIELLYDRVIVFRPQAAPRQTSPGGSDRPAHSLP